jgi:hypothetical protein
MAMSKDELEALATDFYTLFKTHDRSMIKWDPKTGNIQTVSEPVRPVDFGHHFLGKMGVGVCPITESDDCHWAVIDIDNHGEEEDTPIAPIDKILMGSGIKMIPCRSKSGGVHVYAFFDQPIAANKVRQLLKFVAEKIGHGGAEIYPKQTKMNERQVGNSVNMPYYNLADTNRYAFRDSKKLDVFEFISLANKFKMTDDDVKSVLLREHDDAPPCVQAMIREGVSTGGRNEAAYHIGIYLRKAYPTEVEARLREINSTVFAKPLGRQELSRTISSAKNEDYHYRCSVDPQNSLCQRDICLTRKHGISPSEADQMDAYAAIPEFTDLVKFTSDPVRWELKIDGKLVTGISTTQLLEWRFMREVVADKLTRVVPMIKNGEWERILAKAMADVRVIDAPDDASISGIVRARLHDFAARADLMSPGTATEDRSALLRGLPVVQVYQGERMVMFRSQDFVNYLKRTRSEELKGVGLWLAVRDVGVLNTKIKVKNNPINVWMYPVELALQVVSEADPIGFETEL